MLVANQMLVWKVKLNGEKKGKLALFGQPQLPTDITHALTCRSEAKLTVGELSVGESTASQM